MSAPVYLACPKCGHDSLSHSERLVYAPPAPACDHGRTVAPSGLISRACKCDLSRTEIHLGAIVTLRRTLDTERAAYGTLLDKKDAELTELRQKIDTLTRELAAGRRAYLSSRDEVDNLTARLTEALS